MENKGYISHYDYAKNYGFIKASDGTEYFFLHDKHDFQKGDEVIFNTTISTKNNNIIATNVKYVQNLPISTLLEESKSVDFLIGELKQCNDKYFIKYNNNITLPVINSIFDIPYNPDDIVDFKLIESKGIFKALINIPKSILEYELENILKNNESIDAKVIKIVSGGLLVNIMGVDAFLPKFEVSLIPIKNFDIILDLINTNIKVKILSIKDLNIIVSKKKIEEDINIKLKKDLISSIKLCDKYTVTVTKKNFNNATVEIKYGLTGFLYINSNDIEIGQNLNVYVYKMDGEQIRFKLTSEINIPKKINKIIPTKPKPTLTKKQSKLKTVHKKSNDNKKNRKFLLDTINILHTNGNKLISKLSKNSISNLITLQTQINKSI